MEMNIERRLQRIKEALEMGIRVDMMTIMNWTMLSPVILKQRPQL